MSFRESESAEAQRENARALKERLFPSRPAVVPRERLGSQQAPPPLTCPPRPPLSEPLRLTGSPSRRQALSIVNRVAETHGLDPAAILGRRRFGSHVEARTQAMVEVYQALPKWSLPQLGGFFDRDHTTILHALRKRGVYVPRPNGAQGRGRPT